MLADKECQEYEQVEISDLGIPSTQNDVVRWLSSRVLRWQSCPHWRYWKVASYLALVILSVTFGFLKDGPVALRPSLYQQSQSHPARLPAFPVPSQQGELSCLVDMTWSPDGRLIAVLGYRQGCGQTGAGTALVNLYDARSRKVVRQIAPGRVVLEALSGPVPPSRTDRMHWEEMLSTPITYTHVLWSPDGQHLAFTFFVPRQGYQTDGVELVSSLGADQKVLLTQDGVSGSFSLEWQVPASSSPVPGKPIPVAIPPALAYHWGSDGVLVAENRLANQAVSFASATGPVGNPDGGPSFTLWQPGVTATRVDYASPERPRVFTTWNTSFAAWSPDGRYILDGIGFEAAIGTQELSPAIQQAGSSSHRTQPPLERCAVCLKDIPSESILAWSPDGRVLALWTPGKTIDLYRWSDGELLASFAPPGQSAPLSAQSIALRWSGDNEHLFYWSPLGALLISMGKENAEFW